MTTVPVSPTDPSSSSRAQPSLQQPKDVDTVEKTDDIVTNRLQLQAKFPRVGGWCLIDWKEGKCCASVRELDDDHHQMTVKVMDFSLPVEQWPFLTISISKSERSECKQATSLNELIEDLKYVGFLLSKEVENAYREIDRVAFCPNTPYFDTGTDIGHEVCISSPPDRYP